MTISTEHAVNAPQVAANIQDATRDRAAALTIAAILYGTAEDACNLLAGIGLNTEQLERLAQLTVAATWQAVAQRGDLADDEERAGLGSD